MTAKLEEAERLLAHRQLAEAVRAFAGAAVEDEDRAGAGLWKAHMLAGNFEDAWRESDRMRLRGTLDPHRFWNGEDLRGKRIMLRSLHGLGDAVQFLRYVPLLRARAARLVIEVPPVLRTLASCFDDVEEVIAWSEPEPAWDVQVEIMELPYLFRTALQDLPLRSNYLRVPAQAICRMRQEALHVGVVWASGDWNPARSVPFDLVSGLLATEGCVFWNLQAGVAREDWQALGASGRLRSDELSTTSVLHLASFIRAMDLVLTPDSLPAHVAGALGVPAWVMLERAADWRWMVERVDCPWYPSMTLFRQPVEGDWDSVINAMAGQLARLSASAQVRGS